MFISKSGPIRMLTYCKSSVSEIFQTVFSFVLFVFDLTPLYPCILFNMVFVHLVRSDNSTQLWIFVLPDICVQRDQSDGSGLKF